MSRPVSDLTKAIHGLCEQNRNIAHTEAQPLLAAMGFEVALKSEASDDLKLFRDQGKALGITSKNCIDCRIKDEKYEYDKGVFDRLVSACGFSRNRAQKVLQEIFLQTSFDVEANSFNVVTCGWRKRHPEVSENGSVVTATPATKRTSKKTKVAAVTTATKRTSKKTKVAAAAPVTKRTSKKAKVVVTSVATTPKPKHGRKTVTSQTVTTFSGLSPTEALNYVNKNGGLSGVKTRMSEIDTAIASLEQKISDLRVEQTQHNSAVATLSEFQKAIKEAA